MYLFTLTCLYTGRARLQLPSVQYGEYLRSQTRTSSNEFPYGFQQSGAQAQQQYPCTESTRDYFQPTPLYENVHQDPRITPVQHRGTRFSPSTLPPVQVETSKDFTVIREALACTKQIDDQDLIDLALNVRMGIPTWKMFARCLDIPNQDIDFVVHLDSYARSEPREICYQLLQKWSNKKGSDATVAALAFQVQRLQEESAWSEAFRKVLKNENKMI